MHVWLSVDATKHSLARPNLAENKNNTPYLINQSLHNYNGHLPRLPAAVEQLLLFYRW